MAQTEFRSKAFTLDKNLLVQIQNWVHISIKGVQ